MGCCNSAESGPAPPEVLRPLPSGLEATASGKSSVAPEASGRNVMLCGHCRGQLDLMLVPVVDCSLCKASSLPGTFRGDIVVKAQVIAEPGVPFLLPPSPAIDMRRILVVPPVKIPTGAMVDVAVGRRKPKLDWQKDIRNKAFHAEGRIVNIDMSLAGSIEPSVQWTAEEDPAVQEQPQQQPQQQAQPVVAPSGLASAASGFLKSAASAAANAAMTAAADATGKALNQAVQRPKSQLLPSSVQWMGPIDVAPVSGLVSSSIQCGACGANLKPGNLSTVITFRCSCCGVLATVPVTDKEDVFKVAVPEGGFEDTHFFFRVGGDDKRLVAVNWPVRHMSGQIVTVAVPKPGIDWIAPFLAGFGMVCFILDPVELMIDMAVSSAIDPLLEEEKVDAVGRVVSVD